MNSEGCRSSYRNLFHHFFFNATPASSTEWLTQSALDEYCSVDATHRCCSEVALQRSGTLKFRRWSSTLESWCRKMFECLEFRTSAVARLWQETTRSQCRNFGNGPVIVFGLRNSQWESQSWRYFMAAIECLTVSQYRSLHSTMNEFVKRMKRSDSANMLEREFVIYLVCRLHCSDSHDLQLCPQRPTTIRCQTVRMSASKSRHSADGKWTSCLRVAGVNCLQRF